MNAQDPLLIAALKDVKALVLDVDGVLTDGGMYYGAEGEVLKKFNTKDGMGLAMLREHGVRIALITGEDTPIVTRRAEKLKIDDVYLGIGDKEAALLDFCARHDLRPTDCAYVGDDINDLPAMAIAGLTFAPNDASALVLQTAQHVVDRPGGGGVVRVVCDLIIGNR